MRDSFHHDEILAENRGGLGVITLNRPRSLNALSLEMIRTVSHLLRVWEKDDSVSAVVFVGAGEKAFCAGGDVKSFYRTGMDFRRGSVGQEVAMLFFEEEYAMDRQIFHYSKPTVSFMNGITMGGGYGIAGNCKHRVATPQTVFAMPEVGIGFYPDVGAVYHLLKAPGHFGAYLSLTGNSIGAGDVMAAGLADYYTDLGVEEFLESLGQVALSGQDLKDGLSSLEGALPEPDVLKNHGDVIEEAFSRYDVMQICETLQGDGREWAREILKILAMRSPYSVKVTARLLEMSQGKDFDEVMDINRMLTLRFLQRQDMYEGIRAVVIDKDKVPVWSVSALKEVAQSDVNEYFKA